MTIPQYLHNSTRLVKPVFGIDIDDQKFLFEPNGPVFRAKKFSFSMLKDIAAHPKTPLAVEIDNAVLTSASFSEIAPGEECNVKFTLSTYKDEVSAFCLSPGGWTLLSFPSVKNVLLDRNLYSDLTKDEKFSKDWCAVNNLRSSDVRVDPVLCAVEGKDKWFPTKIQFCKELRRCIATLGQVLPKENVVPFDNRRARDAYNVFVKKTRPRRDRELAFLLEAQAILKKPITKNQRGKIADSLFVIANRHKLQKASLCLIAALIFLYEPRNQRNPIGPKLMKFGAADYSCLTAYNSLMDLAAIELTACTSALESYEGFGLATADKSLALLWCALIPKAAFENDSTTVFLNLIDDVLFDLTEKQKLASGNHIGAPPPSPKLSKLSKAVSLTISSCLFDEPAVQWPYCVTNAISVAS